VPPPPPEVVSQSLGQEVLVSPPSQTPLPQRLAGVGVLLQLVDPVEIQVPALPVGVIPRGPFSVSVHDAPTLLQPSSVTWQAVPAEGTHEH